MRVGETGEDQSGQCPRLWGDLLLSMAGQPARFVERDPLDHPCAWNLNKEELRWVQNRRCGHCNNANRADIDAAKGDTQSLGDVSRHTQEVSANVA